MKIYSLLVYRDTLAEAGLLIKSNIINETHAVEHITYASKDTRPLTLFTCKGASFKKEYLDEAVDNGIACYLSEAEYDVNSPVSSLIVSDIREAMALVADLFYDKAYKKLHLIGITGTKGKSTTAYFVKYMLDEYLQEQGQKPCGLMSSIEIYDGRELVDSHLTTPEAFELHRHFDNAVSAGLSYFVMEVSSQALKYARVLGVEFEVCGFLNIEEDHISPNEHTDFEDYFSSKLKIFSQTRSAIINADCAHADRIEAAARAGCSCLTFSGTEHKNADFYYYDIQKNGEQIDFRLKCQYFDEAFSLSMPGLFNVENAAAAIGICARYKLPIGLMQSGLHKARVRGRMEIYHSKGDHVLAVVDYAHNHLSFERLFESVKSEYPDRLVITVFGCPGNKAYNRRRELGELAGRFSNKVYLTMDDPAFEEISDISKEVAFYAEKFPCECYLIDDREEAISKAILDAPANSIVLIAGKGHENCHKVKGELVYCDTDADCARRYLSKVKV